MVLKILLNIVERDRLTNYLITYNPSLVRGFLFPLF
jgi:hypothetical protein